MCRHRHANTSLLVEHDPSAVIEGKRLALFAALAFAARLWSITGKVLALAANDGAQRSALRPGRVKFA